jgi:hypothetical protein
MNLAELFPDGDHRFRLTLRRAEPRGFFAPEDATGDILSERARWLAEDPPRYAAVAQEGHALVHEFAELVGSWGLVACGGGTAFERIHRLGTTLEPDILFLSADPEGHYRLRAGVLCFPTGWALEEKLGHTLDVVHGVVPGLNSTLGPSIHQFLSKLKPGPAFLRDNWGLAATNELNLHPSRHVAPPTSPVSLDRLWLRVEHQALLSLPASRGVVFGIRISLHRLDEVRHSGGAAGLRRALETMPAELARYKRLEEIRPELVRLLG